MLTLVLKMYIPGMFVTAPCTVGSIGGYQFGCMVYIWQPRYKFGPDDSYSLAAGNNDIFRRQSVS